MNWRRGILRFHRAHELAGREAGDTAALLRKARAVFMLRARRFASEAQRQATESGRTFYRRKAARELHAARLMHRQVMARLAGEAP